MRVVKLVDNSYVSMNVLNHNKIDFRNENEIFLKIKNVLYPSVSLDSHPRGTIGINTFVRTHHKIGLNDYIEVSDIVNISKSKIKQLSIKIVPHVPINTPHSFHIINLHEDSIKDKFIKYFNNYYIHSNQCLYFDVDAVKLIVYILDDSNGYCDKDTKIDITTDDISLNIIGSKLMKRDLFRDDYNFEQIGIGGLDKQLINVLRRCLSTRAYKPDVIEKLGIKHVKGMLLYGAPGCGKTLIARKIGSLISNKQPKIVNGPEIMNKYVGESEKNIRELFSDALNNDGELHVIIFDEIDAICKKRQNNGTSHASDSVVNQLLTMIDGYTTLNNIFVIGMTNRLDLLDDALLRAGRLEVHVEIGLPDKKGREQIFRIHTSRMSSNGMVEDLDIELFSELTDNFSGAEIEAVVRNAVSKALHEGLVGKNNTVNIDEESSNIIITKRHFLESINEIVPMFGKIQKEVASLIPTNFEFLFQNHKNCYDNILHMIQNTTKRINSFLIAGENKCGKTVLALKTAFDSKIKNIKVIRAIDLISLDEVGKANYISDFVKNAYISEESLLVIDDLEIAINYAQIGNNTVFSNRLYQILLTILKTEPIQPHHKIFFICTSSVDGIFSEARLFDSINKIRVGDIRVT